MISVVSAQFVICFVYGGMASEGDDDDDDDDWKAAAPTLGSDGLDSDDWTAAAPTLADSINHEVLSLRDEPLDDGSDDDAR